LGEIISKQRHMALDIGNEIEVQNEILDDIGDAMEETDQRLTRNTRNIRRVSVKSSTCGLWLVIVLLFVANVVVSII
jgi:syntaxin 8